MKKVSISKKLAKKIHKELIETHLGDLLEKELPELKKQKLQFNRWIKDDNHPLWLAFFGSDGIIYGFDSRGEWYVKDSGELNPNFCERNRYATNKEIVDHFDKFIRNKYNFGDQLRCIETGRFFILECFMFSFLDETYFTIRDEKTGGFLFKNGKFAEITKQVYPPSLQSAINEIGIEKIRELIK